MDVPIRIGFVLILTCYYLCFSTQAAVPNAAVTITGATGTLGSALVTAFAENGYKVYASFRSQEKAAALIASTAIRNMKFRPTLFELDLAAHEDMGISHATNLPGYGSCSIKEDNILINCAGIYLRGSSYRTMHDSIVTNALAPILLSESLFRHAKQTEEYGPNKDFTVINISSGDGEVLYLHSDVRDALSRIKTLAELKEFIEQEILASFDAAKEYAFGDAPMYSLSKALLNKGTQLLHDEYCSSATMDVAVGAKIREDKRNTAWDSGTQLGNGHSFSNELKKSEGQTEQSEDGMKPAMQLWQHQEQHRMRVFAVCPGNFASAMSTPEELNDPDASVPAPVAAQYIVELARSPFLLPPTAFSSSTSSVAVRDDDSIAMNNASICGSKNLSASGGLQLFTSGKFYRFNKEIPF